MAATADEHLAAKVLPRPLLAAIRIVFAGGAPGVALVGGTALAGFFAGHRRSDDMDLFTADTIAQAMAVQAIKGLAAMGTRLDDERTSATYYHCLASLAGHQFTVTAVLDANLHRIGEFHECATGIRVATLETLLKMKLATLVSRCSEKDLYDLTWLKEHHRWPDVEAMLELGKQVDGGVDAENMLSSLTRARLKLESCGFASDFGVTSEIVLERIETLRCELQESLIHWLERGPPPTAPIAALIRKLRRG